MNASFQSPADDATESPSATSSLVQRLKEPGYAFLPAARTKSLLGPTEALADWRDFADSWNDLALDTYLPDGHRYRRRRHATLSARAGEQVARLEPHRPHYQTLEYNPLVGGIERWFDPIHAEVITGPTMRSVLAFCCRLFGSLRPGTDWVIECHQFRIEARHDKPGQPTPEGVHRDGVDYVMVLLVARNNIASGTTTMHDFAGRKLGSFTLTAPLDTALVDDARVMHGVTSVESIASALPAYRDVLVVTFRSQPPQR